jgi:hypothetical protein
MLNTDRHNGNIREDRKMKADDFVKNNSDYGQDITEKGMEPRLSHWDLPIALTMSGIRTEGEGAGWC